MKRTGSAGRPWSEKHFEPPNLKTFRESQMGRKRNPKSQENDRQNQGFLQISLLQVSENARQIKGVRVLHRERIMDNSLEQIQFD